jgi:hypothetical protein
MSHRPITSRDRLLHAVELELTFDTTRKILPGLKTLLLEILQNEFPE